MLIQGKTIVFTGKMSRPRHEFQALVEEYGGVAGSDVSSKTGYLVVGEKPGSKLVRAITLGIPRISEEEFLRLISPKEDGTKEAPLTSEELRQLKEHIVTLTCTFCNKTYKQWDTLPNYETCPICEILSNPLCPHCKATPIFVTDFKLYKCMTCGTWFKASHSPKAKHTKHLHIWLDNKECLCGATIKLTEKDIQERQENYEKAPALTMRWNEERRQRQLALQKEKEILRFIESLTPEQISQLEETYGT